MRNETLELPRDTTKYPSNRLQIHQLTIGSSVSVCSSRYEARGKFGEHEAASSMRKNFMMV